MSDHEDAEKFIREAFGLNKRSPLFRDLQAAYIRGLFAGRADAYEQSAINTLQLKLTAQEKELRSLRWELATKEKPKCSP